MKTIKFIAVSAFLVCTLSTLSTTSTFAHVVLDQSSAPACSSYKAVFKVAHGCEGLPTTGIAVLIPTDVQGAESLPKPGWTLAVRTDKLAVSYASHGKTASEDVSTQGLASPDALLQVEPTANPHAHH